MQQANMITSDATETYNTPLFIQVVPIILAIWGLQMMFTTIKVKDQPTEQEVSRVFLLAYVACLFFVCAGIKDPVFDMLAMLPASVLMLAILPCSTVVKFFKSLRGAVLNRDNANAELPK